MSLCVTLLLQWFIKACGIIDIVRHCGYVPTIANVCYGTHTEFLTISVSSSSSPPPSLQVPDSSTERLQWSPSFKQAVHFLPPDLVCSGAHVCGLNYTVELDTASGELRFSFTPVSNESLTLD